MASFYLVFCLFIFLIVCCSTAKDQRSTLLFQPALWPELFIKTFDLLTLLVCMAPHSKRPGKQAVSCFYCRLSHLVAFCCCCCNFGILFVCMRGTAHSKRPEKLLLPVQSPRGPPYLCSWPRLQHSGAGLLSMFTFFSLACLFPLFICFALSTQATFFNVC